MPMSTSTEPTKKIRVQCVDDHAVVRDGMSLKINLQPDMTVVATAASGEQAVAMYVRYRPDVTLMDLQLPMMSGLEAIQRIRAIDGDARIVVLTMYDGEEDVYRALQAGAATYLLKGTLSDDLIRIVREVHAGGRPMPPDVAATLAGRLPRSALTARETEVVALMARGLQNKEIAAELGISNETVRIYAKNIFFKLQVPDRTAAVVDALRRGIIHMR
jgi:two-component system NarL family response regulator